MFKQLFAVSLMSLRTLPQRWGASSVIVIGIAGVVAVLVSVLAMAAGFRHTLADSGRADRIIILRRGSDAELNSNLTRGDIDTIENAAGLKKDAAGRAVLSNEVITVVNIPKLDTGTDSNVTLRGVGLQVLKVRPELTIIEGRMFRPGVRELIAGAGAAKQFRGLTVGSVLHMRNADWTVTGIFTSHGDVHESEVLADVDTVGSAIERTANYSSAVGLLTDAAAFDRFKDALTTDPQLKVDVEREPDYYAAQAKELTKIITIVGNTVAVIMAIGAMFGALNTMYSAVDARGLEIATLRAIGFGAAPVLLSVMIEALVLSFLGGALGGGLAWLFFNGHSVSTLGAFAQVVFQLTVTRTLLIEGVLWACVIGVLGGLFPALRAARLPVAEALRAA
ncbi:MAG TPA: ABC transporter permease [Steroidobacteraceae bacterium]|nr:ABC transporter permease [Steroidobacteraceae bacterium]